MSSASMNRMLLHLVAALSLALPLAAQTPEAAPEAVVAAASAATPVLTPDAGPTSWNAGPYSYDPSGNIIGIGGGNGNQSFRYDVNGRLVTSTITSPLGSTSEQFSYDAYANMLSHTIDGTTTSYPTTSSTNHLTSGINAAYDSAGNMTQWQPPGTAVVYHYTFDALHMMNESNATNTSGGAYSGAHRVIHVYTADDERAWTYDLTANESHWRIRGLDGKVLRDFDNLGTSWTAARDYLYRDGALLGAITPSGSEYYTLDHLGTPRLITDGSGNQIGLHTYRPFGQEWSVTDPTQEGNPLRFTGHERDADSLAGGANGVDYMHARFYDGPVGRFLSMDAYPSTADDPQTWNPYSYVGNAPVLYSDPSGHVREYAAQQVPNVDCPAGTEGTSCFDFSYDTSGWTDPLSVFGDLRQRANAAVDEMNAAGVAWAEGVKQNGQHLVGAISILRFIHLDGPSISKYGTGRIFQIRIGDERPYMVRLDYKALGKQGSDPRLHLNLQRQGKGGPGVNKHIDLQRYLDAARTFAQYFESGAPRAPLPVMVYPCNMSNICEGTSFDTLQRTY